MLKHSSRSTRCRFAHAWIFLALFCSTPLVTLLVFYLSVSILNLALFCPIRRLARCWLVSASIFLLCFAEPLLLESLCSLSRCFSQLSKYPYFHRSGFCKLLSSLAIERPFDHFLIAFKTISVLLLSVLLSTLPEACHLACKEVYAGRVSTLAAIYIKTWLIERSSTVVFRGCFKFVLYKLCRYSCEFFRRVHLFEQGIIPLYKQLHYH